MKRKSDTLNTKSLLLVATVLSTYLFRLPAVNGLLYGDDFLLYEASHTTRGYASSFWSSFTQTGGGKYRPLFTPIASILLDRFGDNYYSYQVFSLSILVITTMLLSVLALNLTGNVGAAIVTSIVIPASRFTWYSQTALHGAMEILAVLWMVLGIWALVKWIQSDYSTSRYFFLILLCIGSSSFTHERYVILATVVPILVFLLGDGIPKQRSKIFALWSIVLLHIALKKYILDIDFLQGGGETALRSSIGVWMLKRFVMALLGAFGFSSGATDYFTNNGRQLVTNDIDVRILRVLIVVVVYFFVFYLLKKSSNFSTNLQPKLRVLGILFASAIALLVPASTVISRLEGRWLLGSDLIFTTVGICLAGLIGSAGLRNMALSVLCVCSLLVSISTRSDYKKFSYDRRQTQYVLDVVQRVDKPVKPWNIDIKIDGMIDWQFGYGRAFGQISNPPTGITFGGSCDSPCLHVEGSGFNISIRWT